MSEFKRDPVYIRAIGIKGIREVNKEYVCTLVGGAMCLQRVVGETTTNIYKFDKDDLHFSLFDLIDKILDKTDVLGAMSSGKINPELWKDEKAAKLLLDGFMHDRGQIMKRDTIESYAKNGEKWDRLTNIAYDNEVRYEYNMVKSYIDSVNNNEKTK